MTNTRQLLDARISGTEKIRKISPDNVVELSAIPRKQRLPEKQKSENKSAESLVPPLEQAIEEVTNTSPEYRKVFGNSGLGVRYLRSR